MILRGKSGGVGQQRAEKRGRDIALGGIIRNWNGPLA
jgi:hypothetical protein